MQGVPVKLCYPLTMCAIPDRLRDASCGGAIQIDYLLPLPLLVCLMSCAITAASCSLLLKLTHLCEPTNDVFALWNSLSITDVKNRSVIVFAEARALLQMLLLCHYFLQSVFSSLIFCLIFPSVL